MKFKAKYEKNNLVFMSSIILLCLVVCVLFIVLKNYLYSIIYFILTLIIIHTYYFASYELGKDKLIIQMGFLKIKFRYEFLWKVEKNNKGVKVTNKNFSFTIYPDDQTKFIRELNKKIDKSLNVKR